MKKICAFALAAVLFLSGCGAAKTDNTASDTGFYFDTVISVSLYEPKDASLIDKCFQIAKHYEDLFSATLPESDISHVNRAASAPVVVDPETALVLSFGKYYYESTANRFALTIGALSSLWDLSAVPTEDYVLPSEGAIENALDTVDDDMLLIEGDTVTLLDPEARLDLGGIAKGYVADRMKEYLVSKGVTSAIINLGGNVVTIGSKPDGTPFTVGIQAPFEDEGTPIAALKISDQSLVTSGVYERYREVDGKLYHHILDTKTGYPVENSLLSVTILSSNSTEADALSTAVFAMGLADGRAYIEALPDIEAIFVTSDKEVICTSGINESNLILY